MRSYFLQEKLQISNYNILTYIYIYMFITICGTMLLSMNSIDSIILPKSMFPPWGIPYWTQHSRLNHRRKQMYKVTRRWKMVWHGLTRWKCRNHSKSFIIYSCIVDLPINSMVIFHRFLYVYQSQWIGLRENLQETIDFPIKYGLFL